MSDRGVRLSWNLRTVAINDTGARRTEILNYSGITVTYLDGGTVVAETWVPVGQEPTFLDGELLIAALGTAWR